jgi:hypothetical protein
VSTDAGAAPKDMLHADFFAKYVEDEAQRRLQDAL